MGSASPDGTLSLVERYVRRTAGDHVRRLHALDLIVRAASLARDDARTTMAIEELRGLAPKVNTRIALGVLAEAEASDPALQPAAAVVKLEDDIDEYDLAGAPYEGTAARLRLASVLTTAGQSDRGAREREAAKAVAARIGALGILKRAAAEPYGAPAQRHRTSLSERELEVLGLIAQGLSNHDIGERLCVSPFTVKRHVANILTKLDLPSRTAAASYAVRNGLT